MTVGRVGRHSGQRSERTHLTHHQRAVLGAVSVRVVVGVVVTPRHAEGLVGTFARCRPEGEEPTFLLRNLIHVLLRCLAEGMVMKT